MNRVMKHPSDRSQTDLMPAGARRPILDSHAFKEQHIAAGAMQHHGNLKPAPILYPDPSVCVCATKTRSALVR
jgi:hypothetical protein